MIWTLVWTWLAFQGLSQLLFLGTMGLCTCWLRLLPYCLCYCSVLPVSDRAAHPYHSQTFNTGLDSTFVWPNLYWVWSTSMDPRSFSEAFLLSMNCPSGIALALSTLYLQRKIEHEVIPSPKPPLWLNPTAFSDCLINPVWCLETVQHFRTGYGECFFY